MTRENIRSNTGSTLLFTVLFGSVIMGGITYFMANTQNQKTASFATKNVMSESMMTGFFAYAGNLLKKRKCINLSNGTINDECEAGEDWENDGYLARLLLTPDAGKAIHCALSPGCSAVTNQTVRLSQLSFTLNNSAPLLETHPMRVLMNSEKVKIQKAKIKYEVPADALIDDQFHVKVSVSLYDFSNSKVISGEAKVLFAPQMLNTFGLVLNRDLLIGNEEYSVDKNNYRTRSTNKLKETSFTADSGITFHSPVWVNGNLHFPDSTSPREIDVVFKAPVLYGKSLLTYKTGSSVAFPLSAERGKFSIADYSGFRGFKGGLKSVPYQSALEYVFQFEPVDASSVSDPANDKLKKCAAFEEKSVLDSSNANSRVLARKIHNNQIEIGLSELNKFDPIAAGSSINEFTGNTALDAVFTPANPPPAAGSPPTSPPYDPLDGTLAKTNEKVLKTPVNPHSSNAIVFKFLTAEEPNSVSLTPSLFEAPFDLSNLNEKSVGLSRNEEVQIRLTDLIALKSSEVSTLEANSVSGNAHVGVQVKPEVVLVLKTEEVSIPSTGDAHPSRIKVTARVDVSGGSLSKWRWIIANDYTVPAGGGSPSADQTLFKLQFQVYDNICGSSTPCPTDKGPNIEVPPSLKEMRTFALKTSDFNDLNASVTIIDNNLLDYTSSGSSTVSANWGRLDSPSIVSLSSWESEFLSDESFSSATDCPSIDLDEYRIVSLGTDYQNKAFHSWNFNPISYDFQYNPFSGSSLSSYETLYSKSSGDSKYGNILIIDSHNDNLFHTYSVVDKCSIKSGTETVFGFLICRRFVIEPRTQPLRIVGTIVVDQLEIDESAIRAGIQWSSILHPSAIEHLRNNDILRNDCKADPSSPFWHVYGDGSNPAVNSAQYIKMQECSPSYLMRIADPFRWTSFYPECGQDETVGTLHNCTPQGLYRAFNSTVLSERISR
ncbi:MAG: hypothetical protein ACPGJV_02005 [Bacteriovoracaceae bacterium]